MNTHNKICISKTLKIIGSKWTILLLYELSEGIKRFGELEKALTGISPRTLSLRLKQLETTGVISKKSYHEIPLHVEYSLTPKGKSLQSIVSSIKRWGETYS